MNIRIRGSFAHGTPGTGKTIWLDGYFTNRSELRSLLAGGRAAPDAELAALAYEKWGTDSAARLEGAFAFAVADHERSRFFAVRDRLGTRPLFYWISKERIHFASDCHWIVELPEFRPEPDLETIAFLLHDSYVLEEKSLYRGLGRVPPAHSLLFAGRNARLRRYWEFAPEQEFAAREARRLDVVCRELLGKAVRDSLPEAGSSGVFVSGGLDSAGIAAFAAAHSPPWRLTLFSGSFDDPIASGQGLPEELADFLGLPLRMTHPERELAEVDFEHAPQWRDLYCEPSFFFFRPLLRDAVAQGTRTLFLGHGGDDLFLPPPTFCHDLLVRGRFGDLARQIRARGDASTSASRWFLQYALRPGLPGFASRWGRKLLPRRPPSWIRREFTRKFEAYARTAETMRAARSSARKHGIRSRARLDQYMRLFVSGGGSWRFEQHELMAMRHGAEFRYPFFDLRLIEFAMRLPWEGMWWDGTTKVVLREALAGLVPERLRLQEKFQDYTSLDRLSLARQREGLADFRKDMRLAEIGALDARELENNWDGFIESGATHVNYQVLNLERWLRGLH